MAYRSAEEIKRQNIEKMGEPLGIQYSELWQEVARLFLNWSEFVELYGTKPGRLELLNQAAPYFFRMVQDSLWEGTMLHIARLTDPSNSQRRNDRSNLTIQNFPKLIENEALREHVTELVAGAMVQSEFCRDWRNRRIAHRDLDLALKQSSKPLASGTRKQTTDALEAIAKVLNAIELHYLDAETAFKIGKSHSGAVSLLYVLDDGLKAEKKRSERRLSGQMLAEEDLSRKL
jgi:hypothetical protein